MAYIARHDEILTIISRLRSVSVQELTERLNVSDVTIRKDLKLLEEMGAISRTHGGAMLAEDRLFLRPLQTRMQENTAEKRAIASEARKLIKEGDTIYIDSGSTCFLLAECIKEMTLRVLTNSLEVMNILADAPGISLFSLGGSYRKEAGSFLGPIAEDNMRKFNIETCFIGTTGITEDGTFSSQNLFESQLKHEVMGISNRKVVLADSSKYRLKAFSVFARSQDVDVLIVDAGFRESGPLADSKIEIIVATL